jgi:hypothetical protein
MVVSNTRVYGFDESIKASKYPMATNTEDCTVEITERQKVLASSPKGEGHDNFLCGIIVQFDLTFTVKAWTEAERYHFFDIVSSQSTMHRISKFDLDEQYIGYVDERIIAIMNELKDRYNETKDAEDYLRLLYSNPCGFRLTAAMTTNYRQLKTIYSQRRFHRLPEWREFCDWVESLPHSELITR